MFNKEIPYESSIEVIMIRNTSSLRNRLMWWQSYFYLLYYLQGLYSILTIKDGQEMGERGDPQRQSLSNVLHVTLLNISQTRVTEKTKHNRMPAVCVTHYP